MFCCWTQVLAAACSGRLRLPEWDWTALQAMGGKRLEQEQPSLIDVSNVACNMHMLGLLAERATERGSQRRNEEKEKGKKEKKSKREKREREKGREVRKRKWERKKRGEIKRKSETKERKK